MEQFLGHSDEHTLSVGIICDLCKNALSAQFHFFYDNYLSTGSSG